MRSTIGPGAELSNRYTVKHQLGRGAMAAVYLAFDHKLNLDVALKVLPPQMAADPNFVARFRREGQTLARLTHPHILRLYDVGEDETVGLYYLVLEYLTGGTLKDRIGGQPWDVPAVVDLLRPVAGAVDYAHRRDPPIVHRDLKPANIMFSDDRVVVSDFGLARMVAPEGTGTDASEANSATMSAGQILGTPSYMAPEQAEGRPAAPASDRYALGLVAYELLVGVVPFLGDTPQATLIQVATKPLPPPRQLNSSLEEPVERVLIKALARDPEERFWSGEELVASLAEAAQMTVPLRVELSSLRIDGSPFGAQVAVDGRPSGAIPCTVTGLRSGAHSVRVTAPGYDAAEQIVSLPRSQPLQVELAPGSAAFETLTLPRASPGWRQRVQQRPRQAAAVGAALVLAVTVLGGLVLAPRAPGEGPTSSGVESVSPPGVAVLADAPLPGAPTVEEEWAATLAATDASWGQDWEQTVRGLDAFLGPFPEYPPAIDKQYAAIIGLAQARISEERVGEALELLARAQTLAPQRGDAIAVLIALTPTLTPAPEATTAPAAVAPTRPPVVVPPTPVPPTQPPPTVPKPAFAPPD